MLKPKIMDQKISINSTSSNQHPVSLFGRNFLYDGKFTTKQNQHLYGFKSNIPFLYSNAVIVKPSDLNIVQTSKISIPGEYIKDFQFDTSIGLKTVQVPQQRYFETVPVPSININNEITITCYMNNASLKSLTTQFRDKLALNNHYIEKFSITYSYIYTDDNGEEYISNLEYSFGRIEILNIQYPNTTFTRGNNEFMLVSFTGLWSGLTIQYSNSNNSNNVIVSLTQ